MNDLLGDVRTDSVMQKVNELRVDANTTADAQPSAAAASTKPAEASKPAEPKKHHFTKFFRKKETDSESSGHGSPRVSKTAPAPAAAVPQAAAGPEPGVDYYITDEQFIERATKVKELLAEIDKKRKALEASWNAMGTMVKAAELKAAHAANDADITSVKRSAKAAKDILTQLQEEIDYEEMDSSDRMRSTMINGMMKHLKEEMDDFKLFEEKVTDEYAEVVSRRIQVATGESVDEETVEKLIESGEAESIFRRVQQQQQGRASAVNAVFQQTEDRYQGMMKLTQDLKELDQMMLDFATLVAEQGAMLDNIEAQVARTAADVASGTDNIIHAKKHFKKKQKYKAAAAGVAAGAAGVATAGALATAGVIAAPLAL